MEDINHYLLPIHQRRFQELIRNAGLIVSDFIDKDTGQPYIVGPTSTVQAQIIFGYKDTPLHFSLWSVQGTEERFNCAFSLYASGYPSRSEDAIYKPEHIFEIFKHWLHDHVLPKIADDNDPVSWTDEPTSPELLPRNLFTRTEEDATSYFTEGQQRELTHRLQELKTHILEEFQPDEAKTQFVIHNINFLTESAAKDDRATWKHFMLTSLSSIVVALGVEAAKRYELFQWVENLFKSFPMLTQ